MKNQIPENQTIDIINSDIPTRAVDMTDYEKPTVVTTPKGVLTALAAFLIWGFFPLYFKLLKDYDAIEIIGHRIIWTFVTILLIMTVTKNWHWLKVIQANPKWLLYTAVSGTIISVNWLVYVWAVNHDQILEASLGYYIGPLVGILLSLVVIKEKVENHLRKRHGDHDEVNAVGAHHKKTNDQGSQGGHQHGQGQGDEPVGPSVRRGQIGHHITRQSEIRCVTE